MRSADVTPFQFVQNNPSYFRFNGLSRNPKLMHAVFSRKDGESRPPFHTLNISYDVGDSRDVVSENISKIRDTFGTDHVFFLNQRHGDDIFILTHDDSPESRTPPPADAIITNRPQVALMIKQADCQGIIIHDPVKHVVANVHCGWRGNVINIPAKVVMKMKKIYGCRETDLMAGIGPSLGPCCAEFVDHKEIFPPEFKRFMSRQNYFDLWAISCHQLESAGLKAKHIEKAEICTRCRTDLFYSYRAESTTGRFGTVAMLKKK
jgi:YfiH family protein